MNIAVQSLPVALTESAMEAMRLAKLAPRPTTLAETGLTLTFAADLLGKHLATSGVLPLSQLIQRLALAGPIVEYVLNAMRREARVEVRARAGTDGELHFGLTERGRTEALDAMMRSGYVGPAPVPLAYYSALVRKQTVHGHSISRDAMRQAFRGVVISDAMLDRLGPALNSGRAIFIYGSAGTGKTYIAKRLAGALHGSVLVPHALLINETVVQLFDPLVHLEQEFHDSPSPLLLEHGFDPRYACCYRPVVVSGGELTAEMLETHFDPVTREYSAPLQLKANNGLLLIDDLGRQKINVETLFNRWIVPMEEARDYLTAGPGQHFVVPFDLVLVFSTNLDPQQIADEAFLRRIGYKIPFKPISTEQYKAIWWQICADRGIDVQPWVIDYVIHDLHGKQGVPLLPCHPRDLLGMALDRIAYSGADVEMNEQLLQWAWNNYFVEEEDSGRSNAAARSS